MAIIGLLLFVSCLEGKKKQSVEINTPKEVKDTKAEVPDSFDQSFLDGMTGAIWNYYSKIRMALINSDASATSTAAGDLAESFGDGYQDLRSIAQKMADTDDLEEQRSLFSALSNGTEPLFKRALSGGAIYKMYCPMALNEKGANWFSPVAEVKNPYFGDKMLDCGEVKEIIKK